jgi:hypothetical protein
MSNKMSDAHFDIMAGWNIFISHHHVPAVVTLHQHHEQVLVVNGLHKY